MNRSRERKCKRRWAPVAGAASALAVVTLAFALVVAPGNVPDPSQAVNVSDLEQQAALNARAARDFDEAKVDALSRLQDGIAATAGAGDSGSGASNLAWEGAAPDMVEVGSEAEANTAESGKEVVVGVSDSTATSDSGKSKKEAAAKPESEESVALVKMAEGATADDLAEAVASLGIAAKGAAVEIDADTGIATVQLAEGASQDEAVEKLSQLPEVSFSQPNYLYYLDMDVTSVSRVAGAVSAVNAASAAVSSGASTAAAVIAAEKALEAPTTAVAARGAATNDSYIDKQWGLESVKAFNAWNTVTELSGLDAVADRSVSVAVLDTGCCIDHEDLADAVVATYDASNQFNGGQFGDIQYHGTHVCGIIAASANNNVGTAGIGGNKVGVVPIEVFHSIGGGDVGSDTRTLVKAYDWVCKHAEEYNIRVANMSLGTSGLGPSSTDWALLAATESARAEGVLSVAASGNDGSAVINLPSDMLGNGLSVIALSEDENSPDGVARATYSNFNAPGSKAKNVSAPGTEILAPVSNGSSKKSYAYLSGTSMATPMVAGAAALVSAVNPDLDPIQVRDIMLDTARDLGEAGFDEQTGVGEIDLAAAVERASIRVSTPASPEEDSCVSIEGAEITGLGAPVYNGEAQTPEPMVKVDGVQLTLGSDYILSYRNNTASGIATVVVVGIGNYIGTVEAPFYIKPKSLNGAVVTGMQDKTYADMPIKQDVIVTADGKTLVKGVDYVLGYNRAVEYVGDDVLLYVIGIGNWGGYVTCPFSITVADLSKAEIAPVEDQVYSCYSSTPALDVMLGGRKLNQGNDFVVAYENNIEVGTATATISGIGGFIGKKSVKFKIVGDVCEAKVTGLTGQTFSGKPIEPKPTVKLGTKTLRAGTDYTLEYEENVNASTWWSSAGVTITGKGSYTGVVFVPFKISPAQISSATVKNVVNKKYDKTCQEQDIAVYKGSTLLEEGIDYDVHYYGNQNPGTALLVLEGRGNYAGTLTKTFTISKTSDAPVPAGNLASASITKITNATYTGEAQVQQPVVKLGAKTLVEGVDYKVAYFDNVNAGTARVLFEGIGNYAGSVAKTFKIEPAKLANVQFDANDVQFNTLSTWDHDISLVDANDNALEEGVDYTATYKNNTMPGNATVTVKGIGNYTGSRSATYRITADLTDRSDAAEWLVSFVGFEKWADKTAGLWGNVFNDLTPTYSGGIYDGKAKTPVTDVKFAGRKLKKGTDYTISYENNVNASPENPTVTVEGKGFYSGTYTESFGIARAPMKSASVSGIRNVNFADEPIEQDITVKMGSLKLEEGEDYTVSYSDNYNAGIATVTLLGWGNYQGERNQTFKINPLSIARAKVSYVSDYSDYNDGAEVKPMLDVYLGDTPLSEYKDYDLTCTNNVRPGMATASIEAKGNYTGKLTSKFKIVGELGWNGEVDEFDDPVYNGRAQTPTPVVRFDGFTLRKGTDYTLTYADNKEAGYAMLYVTGKGFYAGTLEVPFNVKPAVNPMRLTTTKKTALFKKLQQDSVVVTGAVKATGSPKDYILTYEKILGSDALSINYWDGSVTVQSDTPKGTYTMTVRVNSTGVGNYLDGEKEAIVTVVVG